MKGVIGKAWDRNDENEKAFGGRQRTLSSPTRRPARRGSEEHGVVEGPCFGPYPGAGLSLRGVTAHLQKSTVQNRLLTKKPSPFTSLSNAFPRFPGVSSSLSDESMIRVFL